MFIAKAASVLQSRVLGDRNQWTSAAVTWSRLQEELKGRRTTGNTPSTALGVTRKREEGSGSERETVQRGEESSRETCGVEAKTLEKKRKRDDEEKESENQNTSERERKRQHEEEDEEGRMDVELSSCRQNGRKGITETDLDGKGSVCLDATSGLDLKVEQSCRNMEDMAEDSAVKNVEHGNNIIFFSILIQHLSFTFSSLFISVADFIAFLLLCCVCLCVIK